PDGGTFAAGVLAGGPARVAPAVGSAGGAAPRPGLPGAEWRLCAAGEHRAREPGVAGPGVLEPLPVFAGTGLVRRCGRDRGRLAPRPGRAPGENHLPDAGACPGCLPALLGGPGEPCGLRRGGPPAPADAARAVAFARTTFRGSAAT